MNRLLVFVAIVGTAIAASAAGYWFGLRQGADFGGILAWTMRGPTSVMYLAAIQDGKINLYDEVMEGDVDAVLYINHYLEDESAFRLLPPVWGADAEASRRESLTRLADYRKEHPSPSRPEALEARMAQLSEQERANLPVTPELRQSMIETHAVIDEMVARYASKPPERK